MEEWFDALSEEFIALAVVNWPHNFCTNWRYVKEEKEDFDVEEKDEHIERVSSVDLDLPPIYDEYSDDDEYMLGVSYFCNVGTIQ